MICTNATILDFLLLTNLKPVSLVCEKFNIKETFVSSNEVKKQYTQQTRNVIVTFSIGFKLVTLNLTFGKRLANVYVLCRHIFDV